MAKWTKIKPKGGPFAKRGCACVARYENRPDRACMRIPVSMGIAIGDQVSVYGDGSGKLAFEVCPDGEYTAQKVSLSATVAAVTIPSDHAHRIPFGTTDVNLTRDGGMLVLDLNDIKADAKAA